MTRGLLACLAYRSLTSWLVAGPLSLSLGAVVAHHPRGDAVLFDRGGLWLLESARAVVPDLAGIALASSVLTLLVAFGWLLPLALLLAEIAGHRGRDALAAAAQRIGTLSLLLGLYLLVQAIVLVAALATATGGGAVAWTSLASAVLVLFVVGTWHDAARVSRFHRAEGPLTALAEGVLLLRKPRLWWAAAWRAPLSVAALALAVAAARWLAPTSAGAALLAPQVALIAHLALRASLFVALARAASASGDEQRLPPPTPLQ